MANEGRYFTKEELQCGCGCFKCEMDDMFLERLDMLRNARGRPIRLTSAYRCAEHNANVGGVPNSSHTKGLAVDIAADSREKYWILKHAFELGFQGVGIAQGFVHLDDEVKEPRPNVWTY